MILLLVIVLPVLAAVAILAVGHRSVPVVQTLGWGSMAGCWLLALVLAGEHWGVEVVPSRLVAGSVTTGGIAIVPALSADQLTVSMLVLVTSVALLVQVYSVAYMRQDPRYPSYTALIMLFTAAMSLVVAADDLFVLLVGWEVMGACSYFLIAHYWEREPARAGAVKAFLMTRLGDVGLLFGIFVAGKAAGTYRISGVLAAVADGRVSTGQATAASLLVLCGVVGKSAQFPLHSWLPDAMPGPTPISALTRVWYDVPAAHCVGAFAEPAPLGRIDRIEQRRLAGRQLGHERAGSGTSATSRLTAQSGLPLRAPTASATASIVRAI